MMEMQRREMAPSDQSDEQEFIFSNYFGPRLSLHSKAGWKPAADLVETCDEFVLTVDIAGIDLNNTKLTLENNTLYLRGARYDTQSLHNCDYHLMEINYGGFEREFPLPKAVIPEAVNASYQQGMLIVRLRKQTPDTPATVEIQIS